MAPADAATAFAVQVALTGVMCKAPVTAPVKVKVAPLATALRVPETLTGRPLAPER